MLDPDEMNADPQPCLQRVELVVCGERSGQRELLRTALALITQARVYLQEGLLIESFISEPGQSQD